MRNSILLATALFISFSISTTSYARFWEPTSKSLADEYTTIQHQKSDGSIVLLKWITPTTVGEPTLDEILNKYVFLMLAEATIDSMGGMKFEEIGHHNVVVSSKTGAHISSVETSELAPTALGMINVLEQIFKQNLGAFGQGTSFMVFDSSNTNECKEGGLIVSYNGVDYDFKTPIPGCP